MGGETLYQASWDSNKWKVEEVEMVSPDSWDSNSGKVRRGRGNGIPRLLGFQQWEGEEGEGTGIPRLLGFQQWKGEERRD